jgi:SAM-dependent methyltransferase
VSATSVSAFLAYWATEGDNYMRHGDYAWMAELVPGRRVLEIGCGLGFGTDALVARGLSVLAVDSLSECLPFTAERVSQGDLTLLQADICVLTAEQRRVIEQFAPDCVVCWLMGAPPDVTGAVGSDGGQSVAAYREKIHRAVAELAAALPSVKHLHLVDRTAIPWQAKDIGRDTLVRYHSGKTLLDLPLTAERQHALYRKLGQNVLALAQAHKAYPAMKSVVPTLASLLVERKK